jgi:Flp pilus assembly protein TadB
VGIDPMTGLKTVLLGVWITGVFLFFYYLGLEGISRKQVRNRFQVEEKGSPKYWDIIHKYPCCERMLVQLEEQARFAGTRWGWKEFVFYSLIFAALGCAISFSYFNNWALLFPLGLGFGLIPWGYVNYFALRKQILLERQLVNALQLFISEYGSLSNIVTTLHSLVPRIEYPLREEIRRLVMDLDSGYNPEEAFFSFAKRVRSPWALKLAHILNLRIKWGIYINSLLFNLYLDMKTRLLKEKERRMETIGVKAEGYLLYGFIPLIYLLVGRINPQAHYLLTETPGGKKLMFFITVLLVGGLITTLRLGKNRIK